ncbi:MAG: hypoxanthine phosphoribosyltransferase [Thermoanaerobaculia bacterium]|nr:hypoxanthine phosphoribosyltransferase [Thermoanaerobaculia bacterium]
MRKITKAFSARDIDHRVAAIAAEIRDDAGDAPLFLLGILKGASCFLADLLRRIPGDAGYGFIDVVRDVTETEVATAVEIDYLSWIDIRGRNVYVIKDVVSTGVIETYLLTQLRQKEPASLKLVALLDRPDARTVDLTADFVAFQAADGSYAGYGLEIDDRYGNLPYIASVK